MKKNNKNNLGKRCILMLITFAIAGMFIHVVGLQIERETGEYRNIIKDNLDEPFLAFMTVICLAVIITLSFLYIIDDDQK